MKRYKKVFLVSMCFMILGFTAACQQLDVIGSDALKSFQEVTNTVPDRIEADEMNGGWALTAPDDSVRFIWSKDFSKSPLHDVMLEFSAQPFLDAGLDTGKLPEEIVVYEDKIMVGTKLGEEAFTYRGDITPYASFEQIVRLKGDSIGYHTALDHYGIDLAGGNMFEWAKDMNTNDKDIVFVLNPEPFIEAGADPDKVEGWAFAKVPTMDKDGKKVEVDKLLKPFNLK
ncbi:hypothetical protein [Marasmitruncus massiliensis]|uniref:hypothetical protein n=1 Tax=Marasmitruncus massiliensis TaxID=1944642 RepID=UPI000C7C3173|nr:hypothetical protein [Marasmitruncus massiliensis]